MEQVESERQDLRATADDLVDSADELARIERAKTEEPPQTNRFRRLSARAERVADRLLRLTRIQRELADRVADAPTRSDKLPRQETSS